MIQTIVYEQLEEKDEVAGIPNVFVQNSMRWISGQAVNKHMQNKHIDFLECFDFGLNCFFGSCDC